MDAAARVDAVRSGDLDVAGLLALGAGRDVEIDTLTFSKGFEPWD